MIILPFSWLGEGNCSASSSTGSYSSLSWKVSLKIWAINFCCFTSQCSSMDSITGYLKTEVNATYSPSHITHNGRFLYTYCEGDDGTMVGGDWLDRERTYSPDLAPSDLHLYSDKLNGKGDFHAMLRACSKIFHTVVGSIDQCMYMFNIKSLDVNFILFKYPLKWNLRTSQYCPQMGLKYTRHRILLHKPSCAKIPARALAKLYVKDGASDTIGYDHSVIRPKTNRNVLSLLFTLLFSSAISSTINHTDFISFTETPPR